MRWVFRMVLMAAFLLPSGAAAQEGPGGPLLPIGGGYSDVYAGFAAQAVANAHDGQVTILVLPTAYSSNPDSITDAERAVNLRDAEERRFQIEEACKRAAPAGVTCRAVIAPIFTRSDASDPAALAPFAEKLSAVFMLGGDQTVAMRALVNTPAEEALARAHAAGAVVAGTSAGGAMQSYTMLGGYSPNYAAANALDFGSAEVWNTAERRGLSFGVRAAIVDQHFFQRGRLGRLLEAIARPDTPDVGVGVDAYTGVVVRNGTQVGEVFGLYVVAVLDAATFHAAEGVRYVPVPGQPERAPVLSLRNVLVHLLAPEGSSYDLATRAHSLAAPPQRLERSFDALRTPAGAGPLLLGGDLSQARADHPALARFRAWAGGDAAQVLVYADGYPSARSARTAAEKLAQALGVQAQVYVAAEEPAPPALAGVTGVAVVGRDQSLFDVTRLAGWLSEAWRGGMPLLLDNAAAPAAGVFYSAHGPTPKEGEEAEAATQRSFRLGETQLRPGLGLLEVTVEPQVLNDNRWGRLFSLAYNHPDRPALGLTRDTAVAVTADGAEVLGDNVLFVLDLRSAALGLGRDRGFEIANGLLDVFAPGEVVQPEPADVNAAPTRQPTPVLSAAAAVAPTPPPATPTTAVPTLAPTPTPSPAPAARASAPTLSTPPPAETPVEPAATPEPASEASSVGSSFARALPWLLLAVAVAGIAGAVLARRGR